jgi:hypothetical protein
MTSPYSKLSTEVSLDLLDRALRRRWVQALLFTGTFFLAWLYGPSIAEAAARGVYF